MTTDVCNQLISILQTNNFCLQIDESTTKSGTAILLGHCKYLTANSSKVHTEFMFAESLETDCTGKFIYDCVWKFLDTNTIPIGNLIACTTDGAATHVRGPL